MSKTLFSNRFLVARRVSQGAILLLLIAAHSWGWQVLQGNLSLSKFVQAVPFADPFAVLQMFFAGSIVAADALIGAAITLVFYGLVAGRAFCAWVCPVNPLTDLANWLSKKLRWRDATSGISINLRFGILALSLLMSFLMGVAAFEMISPVAMVQRGLVFGMGFGWLMVLALFLYDFLIHRNGFCGHLCPLGAFYILIAKLNVICVVHDHQACTDCSKCKEICPESHILHQIGQSSGMIRAGECTNCGRCVEICADDALAFSVRGFRKVKVMGG